MSHILYSNHGFLSSFAHFGGKWDVLSQRILVENQLVAYGYVF